MQNTPHGVPKIGSAPQNGGTQKNGKSAPDPAQPSGMPQAPPSPFTAPAPAGAGKRMSEVLGEICRLMTQSPRHHQVFIKELEWLVMTPILLQQFRLFYAQDRPIGVAFWAKVSDEVAARIDASTKGGPPLRLRPEDWNSGPHFRIIEIIAPYGGAEAMARDMEGVAAACV